MSSRLRVPLFLACVSTAVLLLTCAGVAQSHSEQVQIKPPAFRMVDPPAADATAADLELQGDDLHAEKLYLDALDYYHAALAKSPSNAQLFNKMCRTELVMTRWRDAARSCERAIKADHKMANAYNNLGVAYCGESKCRAAVKEYLRAIKLDGTSAAFFSNLGQAYFSIKQFDKAAQSYLHALQIDPDVFERSSREGVQVQLTGMGDRARYDYTVAKLYARLGLSDQSLEHLKKAMEEGYKDMKDVYKDVEFAALRKDKRFTELMASRTPPLPE